MPKAPGTFRIFAIGESPTFGWKGTTSHAGGVAGNPSGETATEVSGSEQRSRQCRCPRIYLGRTTYQLHVTHIATRAGRDRDLSWQQRLNWSWVPDVETKLICGRELVRDPGALSQLVDYSYVLMELRSRVLLLGASARAKHDDVDVAAIRMLQSNVQGLIDDATRLNIKVAIGTFASGFDFAGLPGVYDAEEIKLGVPAVGRWFDNLDPQGARKSFPVYNGMIRTLASTSQSPMAEPALRVPRTSEYFTDWCHFTAQGEQLMAQIWFETLGSANWRTQQE